MRRTCDGTDPNLIRMGADGYEPCSCGGTFDDVRCSVVWPHIDFEDRKRYAREVAARVGEGTMTAAEAEQFAGELAAGHVVELPVSRRYDPDEEIFRGPPYENRAWRVP